MKRKLIIAALALACVAIVWALGTREDRGLRASVEAIRRDVRAQGFRTDLSDFSLAAALRATNEVRAILDAADAVQNVRSTMNLRLMRAVGTNAAHPSKHAREMDWEALRKELEPLRKALDGACAALSRGRIAFEPDISGRMRVPHAASYKRLAHVLSARATLAIRDGRNTEAAPDVVALSRMVTAWEPEPVEISHLVRFSCVDIAYHTLWESMHNVRWTEEEMVSLQREWESAELWEGLPETAELMCANMVRLCQTSRTNEIEIEWVPLLKGSVSSPSAGIRDLWFALQARRTEGRYRKHGSYEDEKALLLYFRDRKAEMQQAVASKRWEQMKAVPGATTLLPFHGATNSRIATIMNLKQMGMNIQANGRSLLERAVEAEARRRIIVTALALHRFKLARGKHPDTLRELVPAYLGSVPRDVIDGQELRYRVHDGSSFVLYSVGLDCVDNGGTAVVIEQLGGSWRNERAGAFRRSGIDLVWPRLATAAEQEQFEKSQEAAQREPLPWPGSRRRALR